MLVLTRERRVNSSTIHALFVFILNWEINSTNVSGESCNAYRIYNANEMQSLSSSWNTTFLFLWLYNTFSFETMFCFLGGERRKVLTHLANGIARVSFPSRAFKPPLLGYLNASVKCPSVHAEGRATRHKQRNASSRASCFSQSDVSS